MTDNNGEFSACGTDTGASPEKTAFDKISKASLVALLHKKDKELKVAQERLGELETTYVETLKNAKVLKDNRKVFLRFASHLAPDCDADFEAASEKELPINANLLESKMSHWQQLVEDGNNMKRDFETLLRLIWPNDHERIDVDITADELHKRWIMYEEHRDHELQDIAQCARKAIVVAEEELQRCMEAKATQDAVEEALLLQVQGQQSNQAQELIGFLKKGARPRKGELELDMAEVQALEEEIKKIERETAEFHKKAHQDDMRNRLAIQQAEHEMAQLKEAAERDRRQLKLALEKKAQESIERQKRRSATQREMDVMRKLKRNIDAKARRSDMVHVHEKHEKDIIARRDKLRMDLENQRKTEKDLKAQIRSLEENVSPDKIQQFAYMKELILKYIEYAQAGDTKRTQLIPAIGLALQVSEEQMQRMTTKTMPQSWLAINEAVGFLVRK